VDGKPVRSYDDLAGIMDQHKVGDTVTVEVYRGGTTKKIPVTLMEVN